MQWIIDISYFVVAALFILGLKAMSSPVTARKGINWAGVGMILATLVTFLTPGMRNYGLMLLAIILGGGVAWVLGKRVKMTDMPQMVAVYNGMGGGAAAAIAALEFARGEVTGAVVTTLAVLGALIGSVAFSGSIVAFLKLQGLMKKAWKVPGQNLFNGLLALITVLLGALIIASGPSPSTLVLLLFFLLALVLGVVLVAPIGGADMPVVISLLNAFTGLAVGFEGYVLHNPALIIAGIVVGASGILLTQLMAKAMNRAITGVIFTPITGEAQASAGGPQGTMKEVGAMDAAAMMRFAQKVIIVPGYGMAVAGAQHKVWEMAKLLEEQGVDVRFAIHPVAGRMPGHMNVLLAEAGVPYDKIFDLDEINSEFPLADVALIIGANDVVNPVARHDKSSPIYGMPILDADKAAQVIVNKRGKGAGYSGIENELFFQDNTSMLYGSAQQAIADVITNIKSLG